MRIEGFWAGAHAVADKVAVADLARAAGGFEALERGGPALLVSLGVEPRWVQRWKWAPPVESRFTVLDLRDARYPQRLKELPDPPPLLFVDGDPDVLAQPATAIVGTRRCTAYGTGLARALSRVVCEGQRVVVSGLAFGIDRHAHEATLGVGRSVAVLASGLGTTSPRSHTWLRERLVREGGAIVSVWADDFQATRWTFPYRNRWIAALSDQTLVIEAPVKSGALHTAQHAVEMGRPVYAVPGRIGDANSAGCNALIEAGAHIVPTVEAFAQVLGCGRQLDWIAALEQGTPLLEVATLAGVGVTELIERIQVMEARGQLCRLPGNRYARVGYT